MRTLRLTNCLIGDPAGGEISIYAPRTSTIVLLPPATLRALLKLGLKGSQVPVQDVTRRLARIAGGRARAEEQIEFLKQSGVLLEEESPPPWPHMPAPEGITPTDILLVVANYPYAGNVPTPVPFGVMLIASSLRAAGFSVAIVDMAVNRWEAWRIVPALRRYRPLAVGISAITAAGGEAQQVSTWVRRWAQSESPRFRGIVLGGHHATDFEKEAATSGCYDLVLPGKQGFLSAPQAFAELLAGRLPDLWAEPSAPRTSTWIRRDVRIPTPSWDLVDPGRYQTPGASFWGSGCPFSCSYCTVGGVPTIYRPLDEVRSEWLRALRHGTSTIALLDDELLHNRHRTAEFTEMLDRDPAFRTASLCLQSRVDSVESRYADGLLGRLRTAVHDLYLEIGLDGLTERDIRLTRKGGKVSLQSPSRVMRIAKDLDLTLGFGSIFGFPWNSKDDLDRQSDYIRSLLSSADRLGVEVSVMGGAFTPFPGSDLGGQILAGAMPGVSVVRREPEFFDFHRPNIDTPYWTHRDLERFLVRHFASIMEEGGSNEGIEVATGEEYRIVGTS